MRPGAPAGRERRSLVEKARAAALIVGIMVAAAACGEGGSVSGFQLQAVPAGFQYSANVDKEPEVFPHREVLGQGAWFGDIQTFEPRSEIVVTRYRGTVSIEEARAARDVQAGRYGNPESIDYGAVANAVIDDRSSFAWLERRLDEHGAVRSLVYTAVVPYDTLTYVLEFSTSASVRLHPDSLARVLHTWGEG